MAGYILTALTAYLLGSIPTGFLVGKARGIDIRTIGSGNIGATNAFRILGKTAGAFVLLADVLKGLLAVAVVARFIADWLQLPANGTEREWLRIIAAFMAVVGHNYTCWLRFKGGKGIATSAGVLLALVPWSLLIILTVWIIVFAASRYVSLASISASFTLPFAAWLTGESTTVISITAAMAALAIYKHKANIQRLMNGTENRIGSKTTPVSSTTPKKPS
ncbi:MAG TPA: glycerol-3-phosphate 1-O-acyltransferase PlsY [Clostridia bacterium]|nr:glycerol-3-phosphate 1-O-acyltransferase PlsY [Clostridia bacterium]